MSKQNQVQCFCGQCEAEGKYYQCKGCLRECPYCFGAADEYWEYCDDCWSLLTKGIAPQDLYHAVANKVEF